jgi:signal transduction histidine kinase
MVAEAVPELWEQNPDAGRQYLAQLPWMLRGALAEMRTLLLELRPEALKNQRLDQLLHLLADAIRTRSGARVSVTLNGEQQLPEEVTLALYRIAQEALNNIAKHAEASQINIWLQTSPMRADLRLSDDGCGFDPASIQPESLGLDIMRERAQQIGARLRIESEPGEGSMVIVFWSEKSNRS